VRGNSVLFSREYYEIVRSRLKPGGIATQWVPLYDTSEQAIQIQMKTFIDAFPDGTVWNSSITRGGYDVVLLGKVEPIRIDVEAVQARLQRSAAIAASLRQVKIASAVELLSTYGARGPDMRAFIADAAVNRDFSLKLEYISGLAINQHHADTIYAHMVAQRTAPEELFVAPPRVKSDLMRRIMAK
jgi:spermidine synthase